MSTRTISNVPSLDPQSGVPVTSLLTSRNRRHHINQYHRSVRVGKGKHGEVYLCFDEDANQREVAVKAVRRCHPRDKIKLLRKCNQSGAPPSSPDQSIRKEIAIMKKCRHINLVRLLEVIDDLRQDKIYLAMEYLDGGPVQWANKQEPTLSISQTRRIIRDVIVGLEYLHHQGIIHRDIKPANLLWTRDRSAIKIIDFGISHFSPQWNQRKQHDKVSQEDLLLFPDTDLLKRTGTPSFLAPEVVWVPHHTAEFSPTTSFDTLTSRGLSKGVVASPILTGRPPLTPAIDVWSLGVTFYCFLFGHTPFNVPESARDNRHQSEYMLYNQICVEDWDVDETIGVDKVATCGRYPSDGEGEGYVIISLLDRLLQKDPRHRLTLAEFKRHPWILQDIAHPSAWLRNTAVEPPLNRWNKTVQQVFRGLLHCSN